MKIICFGDSNTWGYDSRGYWGGRYNHPWPEILAQKMDCWVINQGENGREIPIGAVDLSADADLLILMLGTNDLLQGASPEVVRDRMEQLLKSLNQESILLIAPPPMKFGAWVPNQSLIDNSKSLAKHYQILAKHLSVRYVDSGQWNVPLAYDGVHLTEEGHRVFAEGLIDYLNKGD